MQNPGETFRSQVDDEYRTTEKNGGTDNYNLFSTIFDNAPLLMVVVNQGGRIENINYATSAALRKRREDVLGLLGGELFECINSFEGNGCGQNHECSECIVRNTVMKTLRTSENIYKKEGELTIKAEDGFSTRSLVISTTLLEPDNQQMVLLTVDDVTEQKMVEKKLRENKRQLELAINAAEVASKAKSEFFAKMSHELRTPLNSIIGFSDLLITETFGELNDKQLHHAMNISSSGRYLLGLINDILDISKIEAGKMKLICDSFSASYAIFDTLEVVAPLAAEKNILLKSEIDQNVNMVYADECKFKQILYNLLGNAIKFTPCGGRINLIGKMADNMLLISVNDNGIGIPAEQQEAIFNPFQQADSSLSRGHKGTGLGLTIVRKFVEMHGGQIHVESEPGKGSTFTFTMPIEQS